MRTNIVLDDQLVDEAMSLSRARSKRALIDEALRTYIEGRKDELQRASYRDRLGVVREKAASYTKRTSAHDLVRKDRDRS